MRSDTCTLVQAAEGLLIVQKRTKTPRQSWWASRPSAQDSAAALSLAAHPKLRSSRLLLLLRQKFGLLGLLGLLLLLLLQHGGDGGGAAGGTSSSRNAALLGALGAGDRKQSEHFAVVAVAVTVAAVVATAVAAAEVRVLLQEC